MSNTATDERNGAQVNPSLFARIRESGQSAAATAEKLPAILAEQHLSIDTLQKLVVSIETCHADSERNVQEAANAESQRLLELARQIENLWTKLGSITAARVERDPH